MSQKASRLPSTRDRILKSKKNIKELYALNRQRITQRTTQPPSSGTGSPRGNTAPSGNFLRTEGDRMIGPIAFDPVLVSIVNNPSMDDDDSINIGRNSGANPPDYSTYVLVSPSGADDNLKTIFGAAFNGQLLYLQGTATQIIRLQNGDATNGGNIVTPDGSEFAIDGAKVVTLIFDPTISPSIGVTGAWRIMDNRGSAIQDVFHATADVNYTPVATGEHVEFNESVDGVATGIAVSTGVDQAQGIFSNLLAGRSYLLEAGLEVEFDANSGMLEYQWFDVTGAVLIGTQGIAWNIRDSSQVGSQPIATAIFTPSVDSQVEVRITADNNVDAVLLASSPNTKSSYARITELGGGGGGTGTGGGGINFPILYPIDVVGTAPTSPTTTDIDLAATTAHVHTLDTVGDVTINFLNPPVGLFNITGELIITTNGSGSTVTFTQTTQPTSSFVLPPNSRNIITFQSSDMGATYDVFQAGQAGGGGGATSLNDLTDVNLSGVSINDIFQFNGIFWINKQSFNFGAGPFGMTGFQRYTNNDIMFSARNALNTGELEVKTTLTNALDYTSSVNDVVAIQARTQHPSDPDNRISISVGSGAAAEATLATNALVLGVELAGATRLKLETFAGGEIMTLKTEASGVTSLATFVITSTHITEPDNILAFSVLTGIGGAAIIGTVPLLRFRNDGHDTMSIDGASENVILTLATDAVATTSTATLDIISKHVSDPDNSLALSVIPGAGGQAVLGTSGSVPEFQIRTAGHDVALFDGTSDNVALTLATDAVATTSTALLDLISKHVSDPDNSIALSVIPGAGGIAVLGTSGSVPELQIRVAGDDILQLDRLVAGQTRARIQVPSAGTNISVLTFDSTHVSESDQNALIAQQAGDAGSFLHFTSSETMKWAVDNEVLLEQMQLSRLGSISALSIRENSLNNLEFNFLNIPTGAMTAGQIGRTNYVAKNNINVVLAYARTQGRAENVISGNEDGRYDIDVSINGVLTQLATFGNDTNIFSIDDITIASGDDMNILAGGSFLNLGAGGGSTELQLQAGVLVFNSGTNIVMSGVGANGFVQQEEITDPAAPATNNARVYTRDNGAGKSQLVVRFPTGAIQVIATEP